MLVSARVEHRDSLGYERRCQGNVLRDDKVPGLRGGHDMLVRHIRTAIHPHRRHQAIAGRWLQPLIGHEDRGDAESLGGPEYQFLYLARRSVSVDPDLQGYSVVAS